jgi:hypothetical protein
MKKYLGLYLSVATGLLIVWFLSGKMIDLPRGTHEAGLVGAAGVLAILAFMTAIGYLAHRVVGKF